MPDTRQRVKFILDNIDCEDSDVWAALSSIRMDDAPDDLMNDSKAAVAFLLPTEPVPKKERKEKKLSVAEISATTADESKNGRGNFQRKQNGK